jgi:hypothetical protein
MCLASWNCTRRTWFSGLNVLREMTNSINPAPILQREARLWLAGIRRRIGGKTNIRNPYLYTQFIMFSLIVKLFGVCTDLLNHFVFTVISRRLLLFISLWCALSTSYLLYYLGCPRMLCLATLSKVFQLYMDNLESGMSMDFLSMFSSNVWNIIIHKSIVRYIVTVVKIYSLNLSQHSHYEINYYKN